MSRLISYCLSKQMKMYLLIDRLFYVTLFFNINSYKNLPKVIFIVSILHTYCSFKIENTRLILTQTK